MKDLMTEEEKKEIANSLQQYVELFPSQNKAAKSLKGASGGTVSCMLQGKWDSISDDMFRKIATQLNVQMESAGNSWKIVETSAYQDMIYAIKDAQNYQNVTWVVGEAGCGKTTTAKSYSGEKKNVFYILCSEDMHKGDFIKEVARVIGIRADGLALRGTLDVIIKELIQRDSPLLIFDEADKLTERVFHYFIDLYNRLEDKCGIIFLSTDYIKRRMNMGLRYNKCGYNEINSRIGRKFYEIDPATPSDVMVICNANGISAKDGISEVIKDSQTDNGNYDLRRVKKAIHRVKKMNE